MGSQGILFLLILGGVTLFFFAKQKNNTRLKEEYQAALRGSDKRAALEAGRRYYSSVRGGKLSIYDEQAITNDLATMDEISKKN